MRANATLFFALVLCAAVSGRMTGGFKTVDDVNSSEYDGLKEYIQEQISARSNSITPPQLSNEMQISEQVVAGTNYKVTAKDTNGNVYDMVIFKVRASRGGGIVCSTDKDGRCVWLPSAGLEWSIPHIVFPSQPECPLWANRKICGQTRRGRLLELVRKWL